MTTHIHGTHLRQGLHGDHGVLEHLTGVNVYSTDNQCKQLPEMLIFFARMIFSLISRFRL